MTTHRTRVLFVCMGNICRSPLAEGVFKSLVQSRGLAAHYRIDSAGTGAWHEGEAPDRRSIAVALKNGVQLSGQARQVEAADLEDFDYVIAMDSQNLKELRALARKHGCSAAVHLLREFDPDPGDQQVPDPYYGSEDGFDRVYAMVVRACEALLDTLEERRALGRGDPEPDAR